MMILMGMFCGDNHCFDYTPTDVTEIDYIKIDNGVHDELFATTNASITYQETSKKWDYNTLFYSKFQNDLFAGNVPYTSETVSSMRIKRRKNGEYEWSTLFEIPISSNEDFDFEKFDNYTRGNMKYEYALVPVINNVEGNLSVASVTTEFDGFYFIEKNVVYRAFLNIDLSTQRNQTSTTITTLGRKYPFHIQNGDSNYTSGSLKATFIGIVNNDLDVDNGWSYRNEVDDFLSNGNPKILKNDEGKMWMVAIIDAIPQDFGTHWNMPTHNINWTEIGDCESMDDMYVNNFIDVNPQEI